jgi:prepilin-type N-terminal cleavage/methylation domain-containing protein
MTHAEPHGRRGATLVELLVVMAILTALAGLALLIAPDVVNSDRTLSGTAEVQATLKVSQGMAANAKLPRGVRLVAPANGSIVTELQLLEMPPVMVANPTPLNTLNAALEPRVRLEYTPYNGTDRDPARPNDPPPPAGTIRSRVCEFRSLTLDQANQITGNCTLALPTLGVWAKIKAVEATPREVPAGSGQYDKQVELEVYPDAHMGANLTFLTYHFGVYLEPRPLLGEPTIQLPRNVGVDLAVSSPGGVAGQNYDIMFAPSGQLLTTGGQSRGQVFLWVRDFTKQPDMLPTSFGPPLTYDPMKFRRGGEQQIVGIRSASVGTAPVMWPDMTTGQYQQIAGQEVQDPFTLARKQLTGP